MVGRLPLEQHIGVRIPGGQPIRINHLVAFLADSIPENAISLSCIVFIHSLCDVLQLRMRIAPRGGDGLMPEHLLNLEMFFVWSSIISLDATQENRTPTRFCPHLYRSILIVQSMNRSSHPVLEQRDTAAPNGYLPGALLPAEIHCSSLRACAQGLRLSMSEASHAPASPDHLDLCPLLAKTAPNNPGQ